MSERCQNCQSDMHGYEYCSNCGWHAAPVASQPQEVRKNVVRTRWMQLIGVYAAIVAVLGTCGTILYVGVGSVFGIGPFSGVWFVKLIVSFVLLAAIFRWVLYRMLK